MRLFRGPRLARWPHALLMEVHLHVQIVHRRPILKGAEERSELRLNDPSRRSH